MAQEVQLSLTKYGEQLLIKQGASKAFQKFGVMDNEMRYDVTTDPKLQNTFDGGLRTLVTPRPTCNKATTESIQKIKPSVEENRQDKMRLSWEVEKTDCSNPFVSLNPTITIYLKRWFNYLTTMLGEENYNFTNKMDLIAFDNIRAIQSELNPSDFTYDQIATFNNENISYQLDTSKSSNNYLNFNSYQMVIQDGVRKLQDNTGRKRPSPFLLAFDTEENQEGFGDILKLIMAPLSAGYVVKSVGNKDTTFYRGDFKSINTIESMGEDVVNKTYGRIRPAFITSTNGGNNSVYYLTDLTGKYAKSTDMLSTYAYGFKNSLGESLLEGLITQAQNSILTQFTQINLNQYQQTIGLVVNNNIVNGSKYTKKNTVGGNINIVLDYTTNDTVSDYNEIIKWT